MSTTSKSQREALEPRLFLEHEQQGVAPNRVDLSA